jgi:hypothetical protein
MYESSRKPLHKPFLLVSGLGFVLMVIGVLLSEAMISLGAFVMGSSLLVGNVVALTKGAIISLGPAETLYAKERPAFFMMWLVLSPLSSLIATIAGFGGLVRWLHG